ncbi:hypothetical protein LSUE1_G003536 [Lachnellula suecica]|uniref:Peptidase A1 domain-containing protein n=1 Tax=Lachnellula suecica TaxID=602035 RepID=A0A8T9C7D2_9HELO|nr:hypothetical protein LSUE1_G003536 [Lachnellula suecica]
MVFLIIMAASVLGRVHNVQVQRLEKRVQVIPAPIIVPPSQFFEGIDGSWSTFIIRAGSPEQSVRVIASTNSPDTIVVQPGGCLIGAIPNGVPENCAFLRGGTFNKNLSTTWEDQGWFALNGDGGKYGFEANLGYTFNLDYGLDNIGLGFQDGPDSPTLKNQTVAGYNLPNPLYLGLFGLGIQPVIYSTFGNYSAPSFFENLRSLNMIPGLSWSYTAGASYRLSNGQFAQLIFGGYDTSRYQANAVQFKISSDVTRDLVVGVQSITYEGTSTSSLLPHPIYSFIESTGPNVWLPIESCLLFERAFGLTWDNATSKYLLNDTQYTSLSAANPSVTFHLAVSTSGGFTVDIRLPFSAFALKAAYPFVANSTFYFPLQRAANATQYTLGRTFLQEAYLTVDYDRGNFSVSQCTWIEGAASTISTIISPSYSNSSTNNTAGPALESTKVNRITVPTIIGAVIGVLAVLVILAAVFWYFRSPRKAQVGDEITATSGETLDLNNLRDHKYPWIEADEADSMYKQATGVHSRVVTETDGTEIFQLSSDAWLMELDGVPKKPTAGVIYELDNGNGNGNGTLENSGQSL